ncbi:TetR/AcrR family transcriptional regulator [Kibdelosporangium philippinense]|uniref:TetR/AcrR family transcriptional regulator n=1 Tax=Kibdelosporangium philippinense TaxID=211113 RepID=A0ABS8Z7L3_9PSEU|nr:TetR/AcrR family transcriptional regulator [Kibdelosporangium philippinense]MCE7003869.1 TetR/AcrR family transcriptional regulator [Kibdelosporangium philippinense]
MTRSYHSPRRELAASATRNAILDAAEALFAELGYPRTTIAKIAAAAQVSSNTVYQSIGGKPQLVSAIADRSADDPLIHHSLKTIEEATTGHAVINELGLSGGRLVRTQLRAISVVWDNAVVDPLVAAVAERTKELFMVRLHQIVARLRSLDALREGIDDDQAAQILYFHFTPDAWRRLRDFGWTWEHATDWLVAQAEKALLAD